MIMMEFTSIYGVVDGLFVSNFVGPAPFAAVNLVMPIVYFLSGPGYLLGTGGTAVVAATLGQKKRHLANGFFSSLIQTTAVAGILVLILGQWTLQPVLQLMRAQGTLLTESLQYGRIVLLGVPFLMLQDAFQSFFAAAEKPRLGLGIIVAAGITNALLDALFIIVLGWGLTGAAAYGPWHGRRRHAARIVFHPPQYEPPPSGQRYLFCPDSGAHLSEWFVRNGKRCRQLSCHLSL